MGRKVKAERLVGKILLFKEIFDTERGMECLISLMKHTGYFQSSYQGDVNDCVYNEGQRNVINLILQTIKQDPTKILEEFRKNEQKELDYEQ